MRFVAIPSFRRLRRVVALGALTGAALVGGAVAPIGVPAAHAALGAGGEFHPVTPARVFDSRVASSVPTGVRGFGAANAFEVQIAGATTITGAASGIPSSGVLAVMATITVAGANRDGYLTAYPSGTALPNVSAVNFKKSVDASNIALLRPGTNGKVAIDLETLGESATGANAHVLIDVLGWFSTSSATDRGARLVSLAPGRLLDTRSGIGAPVGPLAGGAEVRLPIRGADAANPTRVDYVPAGANVTGVILNITGTGPSADTFVSVQPQRFDGAFPSTSNLNLRRDETKANLVMVPVDADGSISIYNAYGNVHLIADVVGYFQTGVNDESRAGRVVPLSAPFRVFDTRGGSRPGKLGPGQEEPWDFTAFEQSVTLSGVSVGDVDSLLLNLTATDLSFPYSVPRSDTFLTVYPGGTALPGSSTLNLKPDQGSLANFTIATLSSGNQLNVYQDNGFVHYLADVAAVVLK